VSQVLDRGHASTKAQIGRNFADGTLADDQHVLIVIVVEESQGRVRHNDLLLADVDSQPVAQLGGLGLSEAVARVGDEDGGHAEVILPVDQPPEGLGSEGQDLAAAHDHAVDVE